MTSYLHLQFILLNRKIRDFGVHPLLGYVVMLAALAVVSMVAFQKLPKFAPYIIMLICVYLQMRLSQKQRSDFLYIVYGKTIKRKLRIVENLIISVPFLVILIISGQYLAAAALLVVSAAAAFIETRSSGFALPTPFSKKPYEFAVGFRKTFFIIPLIYLITVMSVYANNINLGLFSILAFPLLTATYYLKAENEYYIWIFAQTARQFIMHKALAAIKNTLLLALPSMLLLWIAFPECWWQVLIPAAVGIIFVTTVLLATYSTYPREMGIVEVMLIFSVFLPPFFVVVMPYFYVRSVQRLKNFLND